MFNESIFTEQLSVFGYAACHLLPELTQQRLESWWTLAACSMLQHDGWRATRLLARLESKSEFIIALGLTRILLSMASVLQGGCSTRIIHMMILITRILLPTWRPTTSYSWGLGHLWDYHDIPGGYTSHTWWISVSISLPGGLFILDSRSIMDKVHLLVWSMKMIRQGISVQ